LESWLHLRCPKPRASEDIDAHVEGWAMRSVDARAPWVVSGIGACAEHQNMKKLGLCKGNAWFESTEGSRAASRAVGEC